MCRALGHRAFKVGVRLTQAFDIASHGAIGKRLGYQLATGLPQHDSYCRRGGQREESAVGHRLQPRDRRSARRFSDQGEQRHRGHRYGEGKPQQAWPKILEGKIAKWSTEICLIDQLSIIHEGKTVEQLRTDLVAKIGENINIRRFVRWELGEGIEKKKEDYAAEVAKMASGEA